MMQFILRDGLTFWEISIVTSFNKLDEKINATHVELCLQCLCSQNRKMPFVVPYISIYLLFACNSFIKSLFHYRFFGGFFMDIKRKAPHYLSDYTDAVSLQCLASFLFLYCACMSPVITFGGLLGEATEGRVVRSNIFIAPKRVYDLGLKLVITDSFWLLRAHCKQVVNTTLTYHHLIIVQS